MAASLIRQILPALAYIHRSRIIHRDIKLDNLLLQEPGLIVKICDFGLSTFHPRFDGKGLSLCGSCHYVAPEILLKNAYGFEVDIWSLGVTLYRLITPAFPFYSTIEMELERYQR
jgi:serine/threonine protein kinase